MIQSFRTTEIQRLFIGERIRALPPKLQRSARRKLYILDAAVSLHDLRIPPGNRLEQLSGKRKGTYSIRVNDQYRICFQWKNGDAYGVEITDYHA